MEEKSTDIPTIAPTAAESFTNRELTEAKTAEIQAWAALQVDLEKNVRLQNFKMPARSVGLYGWERYLQARARNFGSNDEYLDIIRTIVYDPSLPATKLSNTLLAQGPRRAPVINFSAENDREIEVSVSETHQREAFLIQMTGTHMKGNDRCDACRKGDGIFANCVKSILTAGEICGNCYWTGNGNTTDCSFHESCKSASEKRGSTTENEEPAPKKRRAEFTTQTKKLSRGFSGGVSPLDKEVITNVTATIEGLQGLTETQRQYAALRGAEDGKFADDEKFFGTLLGSLQTIHKGIRYIDSKLEESTVERRSELVQSGKSQTITEE